MTRSLFFSCLQPGRSNGDSHRRVGEDAKLFEYLSMICFCVFDFVVVFHTTNCNKFSDVTHLHGSKVGTYSSLVLSRSV